MCELALKGTRVLWRIEERRKAKTRTSTHTHNDADSSTQPSLKDRSAVVAAASSFSFSSFSDTFPYCREEPRQQGDDLRRGRRLRRRLQETKKW